jgi:hypothetical protein
MREFVKAAWSGDPVGWNLLFSQHYPWMYPVGVCVKKQSLAFFEYHVDGNGR